MGRIRRSFVAVFAAAAGAAGGLSVGEVAAQVARDPAGALVSRLDLERYKATIRGLTQFGDRRQGTQRNRDAVTWIEAQLRSYGCSNTERLTYIFPTPPDPSVPRPGPIPGPTLAAASDALVTEVRRGREGGSTQFGNRAVTGVNRDPLRQPDERLRALNEEIPPTEPGARQQVYCTKVGSVRPDEMYIVGAHMDGHGYGEAANDDGSGTALVMELARILSAPDVRTQRSIRFILWNNEETGLDGSRAYVAQRRRLQGVENPPGSGLYPEPRWLGMVTHDMMMFDHGMPSAAGSVGSEQLPEADVDIEYQSTSAMAEASQALADVFKLASDRYNTDFPASVGPHMTNTDSVPFMDLVPSISLRENERGKEIGAGWNPHWHQPTDLYATYSDADFTLGLNAAQTTLAALARLTGATLAEP